MPLQESYTSALDTWYKTNSLFRYDGQTWTTLSSYSSEFMKIEVRRTGLPGTMTFELYATADDKPTGLVLATGTYDADTITTDTAGEWITLTFDTPYTVSDATMYVFVFKFSNCDVSNYIEHHSDNNDGYADGNYVYSTDSGDTWNAYYTSDMGFEAWGTGPILLVGSSAGQSSASGALSLLSFFSGSVSVQSEISAHLTRYDTQLIGSISVQSEISAHLTRHDTQLIGNTSVQSTISGILQQYDNLIGSISVQSTTSAHLTRHDTQLIGSISVQSVAAGTLITNEYLVGSISTQSTVSGNLFVGKSLIFASWTELEGSWTIKLDASNKKYAQTLPVYYRHLIYRLELRLKRFNNPGNLHIEIRENDGTGEEWYPTGTLVAQTDFDTSGIDTAELEWVTIRLDLSGWLQEILGWTDPPDEKRIPKIYGIVLSCPGADATNYIEWQYDSTGEFENGRYCYYDGASWSHQSGIDFYFIEYGCRVNLSGIISPALPQMLNPALTCSLTIQDYKPIAPFIGGEYEVTIIGDTTYDNNFPFSLFDFEYAGNIIRRYFDDFYYRIHICPNPINLGLILTDIGSEFWVWNAFFATKTLENIVVEGNLNLVGQSAPHNFRGLEARKYIAEISKEGVPDYKAEITFDFADPIGEIVVVITGLRAAILFWRPESKIRETLEWKTAILRAHGGKEQRIKLRQIPRQFFKLQFIFKKNKMSSQFDAMLHRWQKRFWIIPVWTEYVIHSEILSEGAIDIDINTKYADFRDNSFAMIWKSALEYEVVTIDSVDIDKLNLKAGIINNYTKGQYILPIRTANMVSKNTKQQYNSSASMIETLFAITDNIDIAGYISERTLEFAEANSANIGGGDVSNVISADGEPTEVWKLTCTTSGGTSVGKFSVIGSISGDIFNLATVGTPYDNGKIAFTINDGDPDFVIDDNFQILEVLITPSYMTETHQEESDGLIDIGDFETGIFKVRSDKEFNLLTQNHIFYNDIKKTSWELRQFLHWFNGRQRTILIPTYRNDLVQKDVISVADKFLYIENIKLAINMGANELRTYIGFYFPDKTLLIRKIIGITEIDETKEKIDINSSLGKTVNLGDCKICFVDKCRLASDRIEINWPFAHRNECRPNLIRVP